MGLSKQFMNRVQSLAEKQGAIVTQSKSHSGLRIKCPNGSVIVVHSTPSRPEVYLLSLADEFRRKGMTPPPKGFK